MLEQKLNELSSDDEVLNLKEYWHTIWSNRLKIISLSLAISLLVVLVVFAITPVYKSTALLAIEEEQKSNIIAIEQLYGADSVQETYYLSQFEIIKSRRLASEVIDSLKLADNPNFKRKHRISFNPLNWLGLAKNKVQTEYSRQQGNIDFFIDHLEVTPIRNTHLVRVSFVSYDAQLAADIANALCQAYINDVLQTKLKATIQASEWLSERLGGLRVDWLETRDRLSQFRNEADIVGCR